MGYLLTTVGDIAAKNMNENGINIMVAIIGLSVRVNKTMNGTEMNDAQVTILLNPILSEIVPPEKVANAPQIHTTPFSKVAISSGTFKLCM